MTYYVTEQSEVYQSVQLSGRAGSGSRSCLSCISQHRKHILLVITT